MTPRRKGRPMTDVDRRRLLHGVAVSAAAAVVPVAPAIARAEERHDDGIRYYSESGFRRTDDEIRI